jgi:hypothetical protein
VHLESCRDCNRRKSHLENDISVIALNYYSVMNPGDPDGLVAREVARKSAGSTSHETGRPVRDSTVEARFGGQFFPGFQMIVSTVAPPQVNDSRCFELARFHVAGLLYGLTYDKVKRAGGVWRGVFAPLSTSPRSDWGNAVDRWFMTTVQSWSDTLVATLADGFFRVAIREHRTELVSSWALEWNRGLRVIGLLGDEDAIGEIAARAPRLVAEAAVESSQGRLLWKSDESLSESNDTMFA